MLTKPDRFSRSVFAKEILQKLRISIITGKLPAKYRLVESQIAKEYGVSRVPVRSAIHTLEQQGLVQSLPAGGAEVVGFTEKHAIDLIDSRKYLESMAARLIVKKPAFSTEQLHAIIKEVIKGPTTQEQRSVLDFNFHLEFVRLSDNWALSHLWIAISPIISDLINMSNRLTDEPEKFVASHSAILTALNNRDLEQLLTLIEDQFGKLTEEILQGSLKRVQE